MTAQEPAFTAEVASSYEESRALPTEALGALRDRVCEGAGLEAGLRLLEAGAGTGAIGRAFLGRGYYYTGVDSSEAMLARFRSRAELTQAEEFVLADLRALPLADEAFDAVLAIRVFGVVPGWRKFVGEALRVLRAQGALITGRMQRGSDSVREQLRRARNDLLNAAGLDTRHAGGTDDEVLRELSARAGAGHSLDAIRWEESTTLARLIDQNLSGWRVQALTPAARERIRERLHELMQPRWGPPDRELREQVTLQLQCFRKA